MTTLQHDRLVFDKELQAAIAGLQLSLDEYADYLLEVDGPISEDYLMLEERFTRYDLALARAKRDSEGEKRALDNLERVKRNWILLELGQTDDPETEGVA